jgi:hypothetical protein
MCTQLAAGSAAREGVALKPRVEGTGARAIAVASPNGIYAALRSADRQRNVEVAKAVALRTVRRQDSGLAVVFLAER